MPVAVRVCTRASASGLRFFSVALVPVPLPLRQLPSCQCQCMTVTCDSDSDRDMPVTVAAGACEARGETRKGLARVRRGRVGVTVPLSGGAIMIKLAGADPLRGANFGGPGFG